MNVLIIGYGKMGKEIEKNLLSKGHNITQIIDKESDWDNIKTKPDVAIEFSMPSSAVKNYIKCFENNIAVVSGTTGWLEDIDIVKTECLKHNGSFLWGANFSIGMNVFFILNQTLSKIMNRFNEYRPSMTETHHTEKLDKPSGTAIHIANDIVKFYTGIEKWEIDGDNKNNKILNIDVKREKDVKGFHQVSFESENDIISISHDAKSRQAFASGAIMASEWLLDKKGMYSFTDCFI